MNAQPGGEQPEPGPPPTDPLARAGNLEYDRVLFFSDAVFAIAITLLVVDLRVPDTGGNAAQALRDTIPDIVGFAISFAVIGIFWLAHHSMSRYITAFDRRLLVLNLLFLGTIAFLPYPTDLVSREGSQAPATIFYACCCAAAGVAEAAFWLYASRASAGLADPLVARVRVPYLLRALRAPAVFLLSVPVAPFSPTAAKYLWILMVPLSMIIARVAPTGGPAKIGKNAD
jgi:uncharacterized membrane protein